jgi:hypothetical protein
MSPRHRTVLIASVAVVVVAGLVAGLLGVMLPGPQQQQHASLPGACATVSAATLDSYVSGTARAVPGPAADGRREQSSCSWSGLAGTQTRFLYVRITVYRSGTAVTDARAAFAAAPLSDENCRCQGRTQTVPDLGDQAKTTFLGADVDLPVQLDMTGYPPEAGARVLVVRSGNAIVNVAYQAASYGPGAAAVPAQLAATTAAARDALAVLGGRAAFPARVISRRYRAPAQTCRLIPPAVVARYLPGKVVSVNPDSAGSEPPPSTDVATCSWHQEHGLAEVNVSLSLVPFMDGITQEQERLQSDTQAAAQPPPSPGPGQQSVVQQVAPVPGIGDQAVVVFRLDTADAVTTRALCLIFWTGDAEVVLNLTYRGPAAPPQPVRMAHAATIARSILGVLAHPPRPWVPANAIDV